MDQRKNVKVSQGVKSELKLLKRSERFSNESELIAYLIEHYKLTHPTIRIMDDEKIKRAAKLLNGQITL